MLGQSSKDAFPNRSPISWHVHPLLVGSGSSVSGVLGIVGHIGVRNVRMGNAKYKCDATPENCVRFFRVLDHSGMKYSKLIVYCLPVQSAEHFAVGLP